MTKREWLFAGLAAIAGLALWFIREPKRAGAGGATGGAAAASGSDGSPEEWDGSTGRGAGGVGGAGGAGGSLISLADLAAAIDRLAAGVQVPEFKTKVVTVAAGTSLVIPFESGKVSKVFAYAVTTTDGSSASCAFWSGTARKIWDLKLTPVAGSTGANLAVSWPSCIFASNIGEDINIVTAAAATVSVAYWTE